ncbi:MAG: SDR family oxidoreductase, partial [Candidatus Latescibacteria bacterium]|nr:SDR family oxidoreductase [Candidatus Latescibacterota bacterium]
TQERFGGLNVLVNNAGIGMNTLVDELGMDDYDRAMDTNVRGMFLGCRYGVPMMKAQGAGSIITTASVHGVQGRGRDSVYAATKGAIIAGTRGFAAELAPFSIRANVISPGAISVREGGLPRPKGLSDEDWEEYIRLFGDRAMDHHRYFQPLEAIGLPEDIAYCAVYLASDESRFVTGQNFVIDGGLTSTLSPFALEGSREKAQASREEIRAWLDAHKAE